MLAKNQDTSAIETVDIFKKKYSKLLKTLTDKDSVSINMWKAKDIRIPVKW